MPLVPHHSHRKLRQVCVSREWATSSHMDRIHSAQIHLIPCVSQKGRRFLRVACMEIPLLLHFRTQPSNTLPPSLQVLGPCSLLSQLLSKKDLSPRWTIPRWVRKDAASLQFYPEHNQCTFICLTGTKASWTDSFSTNSLMD